MKHAGPDALAQLAPLLAKLRARPLLREPRPGVFHLKSRAFLHFHEDPRGLFADVRLGDDFTRLSVGSKAMQAELLERIDARLAAATSGGARSPGRNAGRRGDA